MDLNKISSKHYLLIILSVIMISLRSYSSIFIKLGGRDTWFISIIATLIISIYFFTLLKISINTNTFDIVKIFTNNENNYLGKILLFIFSIGLFFISIESACVETSSIHSNFFLSTPVWYCLLFLIIPAGYIASKKFNTILTLTITIISFTLLGDIIILLLVIKYLDLKHLMPILREGLISNKILCLLFIVGSLASIAISLPFLKYLDKKRGLILDSILALVICSFFISTAFASLVSFFGLERAGDIFYPEYVECQRIKIANFLEFGEIFYIFRSVCMWFIKYLLSLYGVLLIYKDKIKHNGIFITIYSIIVFIISNYLTINQYVLFDSLKLLQLINIFTFIFIPLIGYTSYYLKYKK